MKTQLIICGLLIIAVGSYAGTVGTTDQSETTIAIAVNEAAPEKALVGEGVTEETAAAPQVPARGEYLEVRNAQVRAQPSAANHELGIVGDNAVLAWKVRQGAYQGARLDGLAVVAVVFGDRTLGIDEKVRTRTVFLVDARASESQQAALVEMAKALAGETIQTVAAVKPVKISMNVCRGCALGYATLEADTVRIRTRRVLDSDKSGGGNLEMASPVLAKLFYQHSAFTLEYTYSGRDFDGSFVRWTNRDSRSAVVGGFWL